MERDSHLAELVAAQRECATAIREQTAELRANRLVLTALPGQVAAAVQPFEIGMGLLIGAVIALLFKRRASS